MAFERKELSELGVTEKYLRNCPHHGWELCADEKGHRFAIREIKNEE